MTTIESLGQSRRLTEAMDHLWAVMADDYGLFPGLPADACLARAESGELEAATPRLLALTMDRRADAPVATPAEAARAMRALGDHRWDADRRAAIEEVLDAWWAETLMLEPGEHPSEFPPAVVLGVLAGYGAPMLRWFRPWLDALDGPGVEHLASIVLGGPAGLSGPAWDGHSDQASQVFGWARTETVINGLTLVGGVHLDPDVLGRVLDRLI